MLNMKKCPCCETVKELDNFTKCKNRRDGYEVYCKHCLKVKREERNSRAKVIPPSKTCTKCGITYLDVITSFYSDKSKASGLSSSCKTCKDVCAKTYSNKEANRTRRKAYAKVYYEQNKQKWIHSQTRQRYRGSTTYKTKQAMYQRTREAKKMSATPAWVKYRDIQPFYVEARELTNITGVTYTVDHIDPLNHHLVCGLHCPSNLQVMTLSENSSKCNRFTPYSIDQYGIVTDLL